MSLIPPTILSDVCRIGQGADTCRYVTMGRGFRCAKLDPRMRTAIDMRAADLRAQGDNCEGLA